MSSFTTPHHMYLFELRNGKRKLAYGKSPQDALKILGIRLNEEEMAEILTDRFIRISPRDLHRHIGNLG